MVAELVIFDCDGVLVDSETLSCRLEAEALSEAGIPLSQEDVTRRFCGMKTEAMYAILEAEHNIRLPEGFAKKVEGRALSAIRRELKPMAGIPALLDRLGTVRKCVASGSAPTRLRLSLEVTGILSHFSRESIFSAHLVENGKPAPDIFLLAARRMGTENPERCVVVEDSINGVKAGVAAGMKVLGYAAGAHCPPDHADRLYAAGASTVCMDPEALLAALTHY